MSSSQTLVDIKTFLWNYNPANKNDKIWGYVYINNKLYRFWGRRGTDDNGLKALQFEREEDIYALQDIEQKKIRKGYKPQDVSKVDGEYPTLDRVYPGFVAHLRSQLMLAKLYGTIRKE